MELLDEHLAEGLPTGYMSDEWEPKARPHQKTEQTPNCAQRIESVPDWAVGTPDWYCLPDWVCRCARLPGPWPIASDDQLNS